MREEQGKTAILSPISLCGVINQQQSRPPESENNNRFFLISLTVLVLSICFNDVSAEISDHDSSELIPPKIYKTAFKAIPFEPLTAKQNTKHNIGNQWINFTIKPKDTLYSLIHGYGISTRDLYLIMDLGDVSSSLKNLRPGQKVSVRTSGDNILELVHKQGENQLLRINRDQADKFTAITSDIKAVTIPSAVEEGTPNIVSPQVVAHLSEQALEPVRSTKNLTKSYSATSSDLGASPNAALQTQLEATMNRLGLMEEVNKKKLSVALVDITDSKNPRLAMLNGNEMMYAASLPKIAILLGAFVDIEQGQMSLNDETRESLTKMIRFSSNNSATEMLRRVGKDHLRNILTSDRYRLYDRSRNGGLWVGKEYGKNPAFRRDPLHNLSHGATAYQVARFYYLLETGQLVSPELCIEMKDILSKPEIHHKFVKGLEGYPDAKIYRKSGTWRQWHSDSALVEANGYKYIAIALSENPEGGKWLTEMISPMHNLIVPQAFAHLN
jgi:beta-lactamase class A